MIISNCNLYLSNLPDIRYNDFWHPQRSMIHYGYNLEANYVSFCADSAFLRSLQVNLSRLIAYAESADVRLQREVSWNIEH